ncbi:MAG: hypothetical protein NT067_03900 [Candidatus Diapherotrites archaeon]|nr:hypothetical protein [Candidatus Diapherotrites archaeon]
MNASKETEKFIEERPYVKAAVKKGLVNYSALARLIKSETGSKSSDDALIVAARRYVEKIKGCGADKKEILALLKKSRVEIKSRVNAAVFSSLVPLKVLLQSQKEAQDAGEPFHLIKGTSTFTVITSEEFFGGLSSLKPFIVKSQKGLVEITLKSPKEIESVPGVVAFLYSLFAERGINIVETTSCWTDTIFVVSQKDLGKALELLEF